jgi:hypothetical protein
MINAKLQNLYNIKNDIGTAIVNKGGTITESTPFYSYAGQIDNISTGSVLTGNATTGDVLNGFTFYNNDANTIQTGTLTLTGNAIASEVASGKTFYSTNAKSQLTGTGTILGAYTTFVAQDINNAKYTVYNGYDFILNPSPNLSNNFTFNRWVLNNSATGSVVLSNVVMGGAGSFNGPNTISNIGNLSIFLNSPTFAAGSVESIVTFGSRYYVGGTSGFRTIRGLSLGGYSTFATRAFNGSEVRALAATANFVYAAGVSNGSIGALEKLDASSLTLIANGPYHSSVISDVKTNNNFLYYGGGFQDLLIKAHESNLVNVASVFHNEVRVLAINNGFVYVGGGTANTVRKYHESNLVFAANSPSYGNLILSLTISNGFVYAGGTPLTGVNRGVSKYHESNLVLVGNTPNYVSGGWIHELTNKDGFIYAGGFSSVAKYRESNLQLVGTSPSLGYEIRGQAMSNGLIYVGGGSSTMNIIREQTIVTFDNRSINTITQIKE